MSKRHRNALAIIEGACNPSGICLSIVEACREMRQSPETSGTKNICEDPAIRLMVYQLAFITNMSGLNDFDEYDKAIKACEAAQ